MLSYYIEELRIIILDDSQYFLWQIKQTNKKTLVLAHWQTNKKVTQNVKPMFGQALINFPLINHNHEMLLNIYNEPGSEP